jgi:hypothetical protein
MHLKVIHSIKNLFCYVALICNLVQEFNGLVSKGSAVLLALLLFIIWCFSHVVLGIHNVSFKPTIFIVTDQVIFATGKKLMQVQTHIRSYINR